MRISRIWLDRGGDVVDPPSGSQSIEVPAGSLTYTGQVPTVTASGAGGTSIEVPAGSLTYTGQVPAVVASDDQSVEVPAGSLTYTGQVPTISTSDSLSVEVPAGSLTYTGQVPTISISDFISIEISAGTLTYTGQVPTVISGDATTITVSGITGGGDLTSLSYCVFDGADIGTASLIKQGNDETTNSNGDLVIDITGLGVGNGVTLTIVITNYTDSPAEANRGAICYADAA